MGLLTSILTTALKNRIKNVEKYVRQPHETQEEVFNYLISKGKTTEWGKKYGYSSIKNYEQFRRQVPLSSYEKIFPYIDRIMRGEQNLLWPSEIKWFSKSSGTTNAKSKFIPVSKESLEECHYKGGKDLIAVYVHNYPESRMFDGKTLGIGGSYDVNKLTPDSYYGDVSAVIMANLPKWAEFVRTPSIKTTLMSEWESKIEKIANTTKDKNVTNLAGVPTWTIVLLERVLQMTGKDNMLEVWPQFEAFFHGAVAFGPYRDLFRQLFPSDQVNYVENYNASEGFFGFQDRLVSDEMLLMLDYGIFYEFIPAEDAENEEAKAIPLHEVEKGKNYAMIISTNGGLWRYMIGDTIYFTSTNPYRIRISGRTRHFINAFGEELMVENAEKAMTRACEETGAIMANFTAAPIYFDSSKSKGGHEWVIEFSQEPENMEAFTQLLDAFLKEVNSDYEAKRYKNLALHQPLIHKVSKGTFYKWMKKRGKLGGQNKVPRLSNDRRYVDDLLEDVKGSAAI